MNTIRQIAEQCRTDLLNGRRWIIRLTGTLDGDCAYAAHRLAQRLNKAGYKAQKIKGFFMGWPHVWVVVDNLIVDITADQFTRPNRHPELAPYVQDITAVTIVPKIDNRWTI